MKQLLILEVDLNYNRKKWNQLLEEVMDNQVDTIFITYIKVQIYPFWL